jgi:hypothetical protein
MSFKKSNNTKNMATTKKSDHDADKTGSDSNSDHTRTDKTPGKFDKPVKELNPDTTYNKKTDKKKRK